MQDNVSCTNFWTIIQSFRSQCIIRRLCLAEETPLAVFWAPSTEGLGSSTSSTNGGGGMSSLQSGGIKQGIPVLKCKYSIIFVFLLRKNYDNVLNKIIQ